MLSVHVIKKPVLIYEALAFEQVLFSACCAKADIEENTKSTEDDITILFWRSLDAVVCGRNQLPWQECNFAFIKQKGISFARRDSGGGTVYHDAGNLNICVISNMYKNKHREDPIKKNLQILVTALKKSHNIQAQVTTENDVFVAKEHQKADKKITGSAMRVVRGKVLHHFTVLLQADLICAKKALSVNKGFVFETTAVRSRVKPITNIHCSAELIITAYIDQMKESRQKTAGIRTYNNVKAAVLQTKTQKTYNQHYTRLVSEVWLYGRSPKYSIKFFFKQNNMEVETVFLEGKMTMLKMSYKDRGSVIYANPITPVYMDEKSLKKVYIQSAERDIIKQVAEKLYKTFYVTKTIN